MEKYTTVDSYIADHLDKKDLLNELRYAILQSGLEETIKWGAPSYVYKNKNVVGIGAFKSYVGIWFFQGGLLKDSKKVFVNAQEGKTKAMRQWRFNSIDEIDIELIGQYIKESMVNFDNNVTIKPQKKSDLIVPDDLLDALADDLEALDNFNGFSTSKKREYAEYISSAKREATKLSRIKKIIPMIKDGIGLNDKYRK